MSDVIRCDGCQLDIVDETRWRLAAGFPNSKESSLNSIFKFQVDKPAPTYADFHGIDCLELWISLHAIEREGRQM